MSKSKRQWLLSLVVAIALILLLLLAWPWPGITERNFERIQTGMGESDVIRILGGPPRDEPGHDDTLHFTRRRPERWEIWRAQKFAIAVYFNENGKVVDKDRNLAVGIPREPWYAKALAWVGIDVRSQVIRE